MCCSVFFVCFSYGSSLLPRRHTYCHIWSLVLELRENNRPRAGTFKQRPVTSQYIFVEKLHLAGDVGLGNVIILRIHHTIGDGMSLVTVARSVLQSAANGGGEVGPGGTGVSEALATGERSGIKAASSFSFGEVMRLKLQAHDSSDKARGRL